MTEAVDQSPAGMEGLTDVEKTQFLAHFRGPSQRFAKQKRTRP